MGWQEQKKGVTKFPKRGLAKENLQQTSNLGREKFGHNKIISYTEIFTFI